MSIYDLVFWMASFFLLGVAEHGFFEMTTRSIIPIVLSTALIALFLLLRDKKLLALCAGMIIVGALYSQWYGIRQERNTLIPVAQQSILTGTVVKSSNSGQSQSVTLQLAPPYEGLIRVVLDQYPILEYGDVVTMKGLPVRISEVDDGYLKKEGVRARVQRPTEVHVVARGQGSAVKGFLLHIRDSVQARFERVLPPRSATLMTGLVLGKSGGFDKDFSEKLKATGTTHLVALSGYNIAIVVNGLLLIFGMVLRRRYAVWLCVAAAIAFVVMTGAEASVVRAAIMAMIMFLAERTGRIYAVRNAIMVTALIMVLHNPYVLAFDVGFQLSFLALLGIIYVHPAIMARTHFAENPGFLNWRENLVTTSAAQLAVLPVLLVHFGMFSPLSLVTNVLLLSVVPITMFLGLIIVITSIISSYLSFVVAIPARLFLGYELAVIDVFSRVPVGFSVENIPLFFIVMYYGVLIWFIVYTKQRTPAPL